MTKSLIYFLYHFSSYNSENRKIFSTLTYIWKWILRRNYYCEAEILFPSNRHFCLQPRVVKFFRRNIAIIFSRPRPENISPILSFLTFVLFENRVQEHLTISGEIALVLECLTSSYKYNKKCESITLNRSQFIHNLNSINIIIEWKLIIRPQ